MSKYKSIDLSQVINIDDWEIEDTPAVGSRIKKNIYNQDTGNLYVFKEPKERQQAQIWSELIASYIAGDLLGWPVQHSTIAISNGKIGNLLGYIYGKSDAFMHGEFFCTAIDPQYDTRLGKRHTWDLINKIAQKYMYIDKWCENYFHFWAQAVAFDTLISNTDRHAQNWAIILKPDAIDVSNIASLSNVLSMSPLYDNATSMGCNLESKGLAKWFQNGKINPDKLAKHVKKGCHHLSDSVGERFPFETLCQRVLSEQPQTRAIFESVATLDLSRLDPILKEIMAMKDLPAEAMLSEQQAEVIMALLQAGQNRVKNSLEMIKK